MVESWFTRRDVGAAKRFAARPMSAGRRRGRRRRAGPQVQRRDTMATEQRRLLLAVALAAVAVATPAGATDIAFRSFSGSAAIGPPAVAFADKLAQLSALTLGEA